MKFEKLETERSNPRTRNIDELPTLEMLRLMNEEDANVPFGEMLPKRFAVDPCAAAIEMGRIIYGAGTSGRFGVLDAGRSFPLGFQDL